jgi:hypothetical protein
MDPGRTPHMRANSDLFTRVGICQRYSKVKFGENLVKCFFRQGRGFGLGLCHFGINNFIYAVIINRAKSALWP